MVGKENEKNRWTAFGNAVIKPICFKSTLEIKTIRFNYHFVRTVCVEEMDTPACFIHLRYVVA